VISAPSGAGKSTIASRIARDNPSATLSVSCTTRVPRAGEQNGRDYYFISQDDFRRKIETGEFLEWAVVHGHYYGTPLSALESKLQEGKDVILTIDPQGALSVKGIYPTGIFIFVVPPSWDVLMKRLYKRATDDQNSMEIRVANARKELSYLSHYDYLIINDDLEAAVSDVSAIITAEHRRLIRINKQDVPIFAKDH
jgi:guanylate kinase